MPCRQALLIKIDTGNKIIDKRKQRVTPDELLWDVCRATNHIMVQVDPPLP